MITFDRTRIKLEPGSKVLDVGCGSGRHAAAIHQQWKAFIVAADHNLEDLDAAQQRLSWHDEHGFHNKGKWELAGADITRLPFVADCFELVICCEVMEHVVNHKQAIKEIYRVIKPGGHLVVSVPRAWPEWICWKLSTQYANSPGGHVRIYSGSSLRQMLTKTGLRYQGHHYAHSLHTPYWVLKCLVGLNYDRQVLVRFYHRLLTWYTLHNPAWLAWFEKMLNPLLGKSVVLYFRKPEQLNKTQRLTYQSADQQVA